MHELSVIQEHLQMIDGVSVGLLELLFDLLKTTNVIPGSCGNFEEAFAQNCWVGSTKSHFLKVNIVTQLPFLRVDE